VASALFFDLLKSFIASMMFLPLSTWYCASESLNNGCPSFSTCAFNSGVMSMECWVVLYLSLPFIFVSFISSGACGIEDFI
jgi:hypothetical protein